MLTAPTLVRLTVPAAARHIVTRIRATAPSPGASVLAGGSTAALVEATVVRVLPGPATMRLLGRASWWAPPACP